MYAIRKKQWGGSRGPAVHLQTPVPAPLLNPLDVKNRIYLSAFQRCRNMSFTPRGPSIRQLVGMVFCKSIS